MVKIKRNVKNKIRFLLHVEPLRSYLRCGMLGRLSIWLQCDVGQGDLADFTYPVSTLCQPQYKWRFVLGNGRLSI